VALTQKRCTQGRKNFTSSPTTYATIAGSWATARQIAQTSERSGMAAIPLTIPDNLKPAPRNRRFAACSPVSHSAPESLQLVDTGMQEIQKLIGRAFNCFVHNELQNDLTNQHVWLHAMNSMTLSSFLKCNVDNKQVKIEYNPCGVTLSFTMKTANFTTGSHRLHI
jgi:hypothetical protein